MNREPTKTGSNNLVFIAGTLIAAVIIIAVLFKAQSEPEYDPELIAIPEPVAEVVIQAPVTPEAVIPEAVEPEPEPAQSAHRHHCLNWITATTLSVNVCCLSVTRQNSPNG
jgi:hypothetical protein